MVKVVAIPPLTDLEYYIEVTGHYATPSEAASATSHRNKTSNTNSSSSQAAVTQIELKNKSIYHDVLADAELRRVCGNRWFSYGDFPKAGKCYSKGIQNSQNFLQHEISEEEKKDDEDKVKEEEDGAVEDGAVSVER